METLGMELAGLPSGIRLEPGQVVIQFARPVELLEKLFALAQAFNDYPTFERIVASQAGAGR
jgi:hypothetical protein